MRHLSVSRRIAAPVDAVWDLLVTVQDWPRWGPSLRGVELDTERIVAGSRGTVIARGGVRLPFEITTFEPQQRWSWRVAGVSATDHTVHADGDATVVRFGVPMLVAPYAAVCVIALRRLERLADPSAPRGRFSPRR